MTKEDFGVELFDAIKAQGAYSLARKQGKTKDAASWAKELKVLLPKIPNPDDVRRILAMR